MSAGKTAEKKAESMKNDIGSAEKSAEKTVKKAGSGKSGEDHAEENGKGGKAHAEENGKGGKAHAEENSKGGKAHAEENGKGGKAQAEENGKGGKTKEQRIRAEKSRLRKLYRELPDLKKKLAEPVIERASFMRVEMEDLEEDLRENGWTELFSQSDKTEPYERARPSGQSYQSLIGNYQKIIKLLDSFLPPPETKQKNTVDPFDEFIAERDR